MLVIGGNKKGVSRIFTWFCFLVGFGFDWAVVRSVLCSFIFCTFLLMSLFAIQGEKVLSLVFLLDSHSHPVTNLYLGSYLC